MVASRPLGWLPLERLGAAPRAAPRAGGSSADHALEAEALGCDEAYLIPRPSSHGGPPHRVAGPRWSLRLARSADAPRRSYTVTKRLELRLRHSEDTIHTAVRQSRWPGPRGAEPTGVYGHAGQSRQYPGRDLPAAQAAGRLHRVRALPVQMRGQQRGDVVDRSAGCCTAARSAKPRPATKARCSRSPDAPGVATRARGSSSAGCVESVMSAGDQEALWVWLQTPSGGSGVAGLAAAAGQPPFADPRRSLAASRLGQLRAHESDRADCNACVTPIRVASFMSIGPETTGPRERNSV